MATTSDIIEALKYTYGADRLELILNTKSIAWNLFRKKQARAGGRGQHIIPVGFQLPEGIAGITEGGTLPSALQPDTDEATFSLQEYAGLYDVSWKLMSDSQRDEHAFEQAVTMLDSQIRKAFVQDLSNDFLSDGRGVLAFLPAADNTSPVTVSRPIRARQGMVVDIMDTDDDAKHLDSGTVNAVTFGNNTITVSGSISSTGANDYFVREDTADDSVNDSLHVNGIAGIVDDADPASIVGDYGGIDRGTAGNEFWESEVFDNGGTNRSLTEDLMLEAMLEARLKGDSEIDAILTSPGVYRRYYQLFAAEATRERGGGDGMSGTLGPDQSVSDTGETALSFSGVPIHFDDFARANEMYFLDTSDWSIAHGQNRVPQPVSETFDDASMLRDTANATFEVALWWQGELICRNPAGQVKIEDIAES